MKGNDDEEAIVAGMLAALKEVGTQDRAAREKSYLKSDLNFLGARVPNVRAVCKDVVRARPEMDHDGLADLVTACWSRPIHELRMAATVLLQDRSDLLSVEDVPLLERLLRESRTWALLDNLAVHVVGDLLEHFPDEMDGVVRRWAIDDDFWIRRAGLLAHLTPLRDGGRGFDRFAELADPMLEDREFFIRKAIGWVLRETGKRNPDLVVEWLTPRAARASGLTVREATRRLPDEVAAPVLEAHAGR